MRVDISVRSGRRVEAREFRRRNPVPGHEFLGELFGALQQGAGPGRAEDPQPLRTEQIDDSFGKRRLGSHHGEVDIFGQRKFSQLVDRRDHHVLQAGLARGAAVARGDENFLHARALRQPPRDCVFPAARADDEEFHAAGNQWRKCRTPVNTMASPSSSAAAITSSSRTLPPGWITAFAPARATTSTPSRNGKKASEATTEPASESFAACAFISARRELSTRLIWPAPTPSVMPSRQKTMAFDFTNFATRQANSRSLHCDSEGFAFVTTRISFRCAIFESLLCTSNPPPTRL